MINFEQKDRFWSNRNHELEMKLKNLGKPSKRYLSGTKVKISKNQANFEELRLIHELSQEEIADLKATLSNEKAMTNMLKVKIQIYKDKIHDLEENTQAMAKLVNKTEDKVGKATARFTIENPKEVERIKEECRTLQYKNISLERENAENREDSDSKINDLNIKVFENQKENITLKESIKKLEKELYNSRYPDQKTKDYIEILLLNIRDLENEVCNLNKRNQSLNPLNLQAMNDLADRYKKLEDENLNLKEQIEIYKEDHVRKSLDNNLLQHLSFITLSKDKSSLDPEAAKILQRTIGEHPTKLIESFQEKAYTFEKENIFLSQRLNQELQTRIENLEKIKILQESLNKLVNEPSIQSDLSRTKAQIAAAKSVLTNNFHPKASHSLDLRGMDRDTEFEALKSEIKLIRTEKEKMKDEYNKCIDLVGQLENKLYLYELKPSEADTICFLQCEAAALEDMLAKSEERRPELDSEELY